MQLPTGATQVQILDATGRVVLTQPAASGELIRLRFTLPSGVYVGCAGAETAQLVVE